jgi:hypothetical protein
LGLEKPSLGLDPGETFFPNSVSDLDSAETFQISRNLGLDIDENVCLLDSQPWFGVCLNYGSKLGSGPLFMLEGFEFVNSQLETQTVLFVLGCDQEKIIKLSLIPDSGPASVIATLGLTVGRHKSEIRVSKSHSL